MTQPLMTESHRTSQPWAFQLERRQAVTLLAEAAPRWLRVDSGRVWITARDGTRLQFDAQWTALHNIDDTTNVLTLAGTVEHQFSATPFAGFANVRWDNVTHTFNQQISATAVSIGIRAYFGGSALDNDRNGATMDVLPLPILLGLNFG